jgi:Cu(I)/Ag(I) efflux system membrane fusion protein
MRTALAAHDEAQALLAADRLPPLAARAARLAQALALAAQGLGDARPDVRERLERGADEARRMETARDLAVAREAYGGVERELIPVVAADARLAGERQVFSCPMTATFPKWMQRRGEKQNPYLGAAMPTCADPSDWTVPAADAGAGTAAGDAPNEDAVVQMSAARRQSIGVVVAAVQRQPLSLPVRAVGKVVVDESRLTDVTVKYKGFIGHLYVDRPGQAVRKGQPLFSLYSPELYAAQQEYLIALRSQGAAQATSAPDRADYLVGAARQRLLLWDLTPAQIDRLATGGKAIAEVPILSPAAGVVVSKNVVSGSAVEPGMQLFRLAALDQVWVEAEVYESELALLRPGDHGLVSFPYLPGRNLVGTIAFVYPFLDPTSRTGRVRIELRNPGLDLKPDMLANVTLTKSLGERLVAPQDAVLYSGDRTFVFLDLGDGRLRPQRVTLGQPAGELVEVVAGLHAGDRIVISGNFLVAAESRLKLAMEQWR